MTESISALTASKHITEFCRRAEQRFDTPGKTALLQTAIDVEVLNQSPNGICIQFRNHIELSLNQNIMLVVDGVEKAAIIRWIKVADSGRPISCVGCEFVPGTSV